MQQCEQLDAYLAWLSERGIRYPVRRANATPSAVAFLSATQLTDDERALLDRMIAAMKLPPSRVRIGVGRLPAGDPPLRLAILLGDVAAPAGCPVMQTLHPGELLRDPAKKRQAWADLQGAMTTLGLA